MAVTSRMELEMRILIFRLHGYLCRPAGDQIPITLEGHRSRGFAKIIMSIRTATLTSNNNIEIRSVELLNLRTQNLNLTVSTLDCVTRDARCRLYFGER